MEGNGGKGKERKEREPFFLIWITHGGREGKGNGRMQFPSLFNKSNPPIVGEIWKEMTCLSSPSPSFPPPSFFLPSLPFSPCFLTKQAVRITVIPLSIAALCLTVTNNEDNPDYGSIQYLNFSGLQYMGAVAGIGAGYAFIAAISIWVRCLVNRTWVFFVSDQVMAYLMVTSGAAGAELLYLSYKGDVEVSWSEACSAYGNFCTKLKIAVVLHFLALFCFLVLAIISAFRAFTMFDPPLTINQQEQET